MSDADAGDGVRRVAEPVAQQQAETGQHRHRDRLAEPVGAARAPALHGGHQQDTRDQRALRRHAARDPGPLRPQRDAHPEPEQERAREGQHDWLGEDFVEAEAADPET